MLGVMDIAHGITEAAKKAKLRAGGKQGRTGIWQQVLIMSH